MRSQSHGTGGRWRRRRECPTVGGTLLGERGRGREKRVVKALEKKDGILSRSIMSSPSRGTYKRARLYPASEASGESESVRIKSTGTSRLQRLTSQIGTSS